VILIVLVKIVFDVSFWATADAKPKSNDLMHAVALAGHVCSVCVCVCVWFHTSLADTLAYR